MRAIILLVLVLFAVSNVSAIELLTPIARQVNAGDTVYVGMIGPGQTISLTINPRVYSGGVNNIGGNYDIAVVKTLPVGWKSKDSKLYGKPLQVQITAAKDAEEGEYITNIEVQDEGDGEKLGNITFTAKIKVVRDVLDVDIEPNSIKTGAGQPARFFITVKNKGTAEDVFEISSYGRKEWNMKKYIYVPANTAKTVTYEIIGEEEEEFNQIISVVSISSNLVSKEGMVSVKVYSDVLSDYRATNHGVLLFPIIQGPVYAFAGVLSNLW